MHHLTKRWKKIVVLGVALVLAPFLMAAQCDEPEAQQSESKTQQSSYERLVAGQPSVSMNYSPTRATIQQWIKKWSVPNKLSYVYLQASNGQLVGYYIFKGLPVSYCASLTPTYRVDRSSNGNLMLPAPSVDGVYYSGGQCQAYYGIDATTGSYIEYTVGTGISALVYERPLPRQDVKPLGFTEIKDVK